jgi:hypothetical protein
MFPLNTIIAWSINIIMNKKYDNNNIIIASRTYFLHIPRASARTIGQDGRSRKFGTSELPRYGGFAKQPAMGKALPGVSDEKRSYPKTKSKRDKSNVEQKRTPSSMASSTSEVLREYL